MKLEQLHVYGYGKIENEVWDVSALTVFYGKNEAGKSTIRAFIKSILFGFPTRAQYRYAPKLGGAYGGAVIVSTERYGRVKIERMASGLTVYMEDGTTGGEELLRDILGGMDSLLFDSVFSFDVHGLQRIHNMSRDDLGKYLFSAGAVGTDILLQLEKKLEKEMEMLFKPNGRKPVINEMLPHITKLRADVQKWQQRLSAYEALVEQRTSYEEKLRCIEKEKKELHARRSDYETMHALQPLLLEEQKYKRMLAERSSSSFPENGVLRFEKVQTELKHIQLQLHTAMKKIDELEEGLRQLSIRQELLAEEASVEQCRLRHISYEAAKQDVHVLALSVAQLEEELGELQRSIGFVGESEQFFEWDTSLTAKETVVQTVQKASRMSEWKERLDEQFTGAKELLEEQERQVTYIQQQLLPPEQRSKYEQLAQTAASEEMQPRKKRLPEQAIRKKRSWNTAFVILLSLDTIAMLLSLFLRESVFFITCLVIFTALVAVFAVGRKQEASAMKEQERQISIGGSGADPEGIAARHILEHDAQLQQLLERERFKMEQAERAYERVVSQYEDWERDTFILERNVERFTHTYGLAKELPVSQFVNAFERMEKLQRSYREYKKQTERMCVLQEQIRAFEQDMKQLCDAFAIVPDTTVSGLHQMLTILQEEKQKLQLQEVWKQSLLERSEERDELLQKKQQYEAERDELWGIAGARDEEEYLQKGREAEEAQEAKKQLAFLGAQIDMLKVRLVSCLEDEAWASDYAELLRQGEERLKEIDEEQRALQGELAQLRVDMGLLEEGTTYGHLLHELEAKKSRLRELVKKWASYAAAKAILTKTTKRYYEEKLPRILSEAEQYFTYVTGGEYVRVFAPSSESSFLVERKDGMRFFAYELSQATAEQLYLSLRLALASSFGTYPLVIDDSFVHFDQERAERTVKLLGMLSSERQILFFTCHAHFVSLFEGASIHRVHRAGTD